MVGEFRRRAKAFSHARYATQDRTWFPELSDVGDARKLSTFDARKVSGF